MAVSFTNQGYTTGCVGCIAGFTPYFKSTNKEVFLSFDKNDMCVTEVMLKRFIKTMKNWGFPVELVEKEVYQIHYKPELFQNNKHFLAAYTISRYLIEDGIVFQFYTGKVISQMYEYKKKYKKLDLFQCFQLAQYKCMPGYHDPNHSCFKQVSKLVSKAEMQKKIPNLYLVNSLFFKDYVEGYKDYNSWDLLHKLINRDEAAALKLLL